MVGQKSGWKFLVRKETSFNTIEEKNLSSQKSFLFYFREDNAIFSCFLLCARQKETYFISHHIKFLTKDHSQIHICPLLIILHNDATTKRLLASFMDRGRLEKDTNTGRNCAGQIRAVFFKSPAWSIVWCLSSYSRDVWSASITLCVHAAARHFQGWFDAKNILYPGSKN